jgi:hypothetical protein
VIHRQTIRTSTKRSALQHCLYNESGDYFVKNNEGGEFFVENNDGGDFFVEITSNQMAPMQLVDPNWLAQINQMGANQMAQMKLVGPNWLLQIGWPKLDGPDWLAHIGWPKSVDPNEVCYQSATQQFQKMTPEDISQTEFRLEEIGPEAITEAVTQIGPEAINQMAINQMAIIQMSPMKLAQKLFLAKVGKAITHAGMTSSNYTKFDSVSILHADPDVNALHFIFTDTYGRLITFLSFSSSTYATESSLTFRMDHVIMSASFPMDHVCSSVSIGGAYLLVTLDHGYLGL